ncbi:techylectin-5A [Nephila pilipes]|uniref:Techylectin-5A n=1 Tax=Nephila pilipes TaxID=299642 RepID=A0A8X6N5F3_NEPPI|nr:techylectin-5A [Nephila pilipes]
MTNLMYSTISSVNMKLFLTCGVSLLILILVSLVSLGESTVSGEKKKALALLDLAEDSLSKAKQLYLSCESNQSRNGEELLETTKNSISEAKEHIKLCDKSKSLNSHDKPVDCFEVLENGNNRSGVYTIYPRNRLTSGKSVDVYCDMETDDGGWTVIQRRGDYPEQQDFYQNWTSYKNGFGDITRDFWLGNDNIYALSNQKVYEVRFDLQDAKGDHRYALYKSFWIDDEHASYALHINDYSGNAGDSMQYHDGYKFSTKDRNNNKCARMLKGGWWYLDWAHTNLNGIYKPGVNSVNNIHWWRWHANDGLAGVEIKVRPL